MRYNFATQKPKYKNKKVEVDGVLFDSKKEARRYTELKLLEKAGKIRELELQKVFELIPSQREPDTIGKNGGVHKGKVIERAVVYKADFAYFDADGKYVVEDTKGFRTTEYVIKRKLMLYLHGIRIKEI